jgi:pimeloyl-ACP methyl ester carboxylesterase
VIRHYPGFYLSKLGGRLPDPLPAGSSGALMLPGMFSRVHIYGRVLDAIRAKGVPASGLHFGANMWGTIGDRVERLRAAVAAHAATGGRVVLVAHSMGTLVCARYLLERPSGVAGFVSVSGVFGGLKPWTLLGWPIFTVVREMKNETGARLSPALQQLLRERPVPITIFQADQDEFVKDQSGVTEVVRFDTCVSHNGPVLEDGALDAIACRVAEYAAGRA